MDTALDAMPHVTRAANLDDRERPRFVATGASSTGRVRPTNEDRAQILTDLGLLLVADGVSGKTGESGGAEAAQLAVDTIASAFTSDGETTAPNVTDLTHGLAAGLLRAAIEHADRRIADQAKRTKRPGMATTIAALLVAGPRVVVAHVGDSRVYRQRGGALERLTIDHTEQALWEQMHRRPAPPQVRQRLGHVLMHALGGHRPGVRVEVRAETWEPGDLFLLSTDGLHGLVSDDAMAATLASAPDLDRAVVQLVNHANAAGGGDNITAILVRML